MCDGRRLDTNRCRGAMLSRRASSRAISLASTAPMLWPKNAKGRLRWGNKVGRNASTSAGIVRIRGSRHRLPRPGSSTAHTSSQEGNPAGHKRKVDAAPPAWEKQNRLTPAWGLVAGRCNQSPPLCVPYMSCLARRIASRQEFPSITSCITFEGSYAGRGNAPRFNNRHQTGIS